MAKHLTMSLDLPDKKEVDKLKLNETVTLAVTGKVTRLSASHIDEFISGPSTAKTIPASVTLDVDSVKVKVDSNAFSKLAEDEDEDE